MKKINVVRMMKGWGVQPVQFVPFPGQNPLRLFVRVDIPVLSGRKTRYQYDGKFNLGVLRKAQRVATGIGETAVSQVIVYVKTGPLYAGTLDKGIAAPLFYAFFCDPNVSRVKKVAGALFHHKWKPVRIGRGRTVYWYDRDNLIPVNFASYCKNQYWDVMRGR